MIELFYIKLCRILPTFSFFFVFNVQCKLCTAGSFTWLCQRSEQGLSKISPTHRFGCIKNFTPPQKLFGPPYILNPGYGPARFHCRSVSVDMKFSPIKVVASTSTFWVGIYTSTWKQPEFFRSLFSWVSVLHKLWTNFPRYFFLSIYKCWYFFLSGASLARDRCSKCTSRQY